MAELILAAASPDSSLKSPNMSADSGFEGDSGHRPLLLQPPLPKEEEIRFWRKDVALSMEEDAKKSLEDSDFNESPLEKKSVPSESDPEEGANSTSYCNGQCDRTIWLEEENVEDPLQHKECKRNCENCFPSLEAAVSDPDCPAPQQGGGQHDASGSSSTLTRRSTPSQDSTAGRSAYFRCLRSRSEPSRYTTVVKPKAVKPQPAVLLERVGGYRSSLESLHGAFSQRQERLSAFQERPASSLSDRDTPHLFFSRSLENPLLPPSQGLSPARGSSLHNVSSSLHTYADINATAKRKPSSDSTTDSSANPSEEASPVKRHSMPWDLFWSHDAKDSPNYDPYQEPIHMTLEEVRTSLQTLDTALTESFSDKPKNCRKSLGSYLWPRRIKTSSKKDNYKLMQRKSFPSSLRAAFNNFFGAKKGNASSSLNSPSNGASDGAVSGAQFPTSQSSDEEMGANGQSSPRTSPFTHRALPPLPPSGDTTLIWAGDCLWTPEEDSHKRKMDYAASIEKVKDCGWYWGPISGEMAEKLLAKEPDGSFVVRDSSDEHYIFSLTFKLNGLVRHVRIEHDHGNFSFGCKHKFRSNTIVEFIENAVAHSRSGRYLFFLHRRPVLGPMQVQLLHPVSRFKQVQSLQHLCRFVILKHVRKDLIDGLPLPRKLQCYLNTPHYYSELALVSSI